MSQNPTFQIYNEQSTNSGKKILSPYINFGGEKPDPFNDLPQEDLYHFSINVRKHPEAGGSAKDLLFFNTDNLYYSPSSSFPGDARKGLPVAFQRVYFDAAEDERCECKTGPCPSPASRRRGPRRSQRRRRRRRNSCASSRACNEGGASRVRAQNERRGAHI